MKEKPENLTEEMVEEIMEEVPKAAGDEAAQEADKKAEAAQETAEETAKETKAADENETKLNGSEKKGGKHRVFAVLSFLSAAVAISIALFMLYQCILLDENRVTGDSYVRVLNPLDDEAESFRDTQQFEDYFYTDVMHLSDGLARASQLDTNGQYDGDKLIDVISYYYRKNPEKMPECYKNLSIEYKASDLVAWYESGFGVEGMDWSDWSDNYPQYAKNAPATDDSMSYDVIQEFFLPADGVSLYERDYEDPDILFCSQPGSAVPGISEILQADMEGLASNVYSYARSNEWMRANQNFKYVLFGPDGRIIKSDLYLNREFLDSERNVRNKKIEEAFRAQKTWLAYTYGKGKVEAKGIGMRTEQDYLTQLNRYDYMHETGTTLLVCVLDENKSDKVLGAYHTNDCYGDGDSGYHAIHGKGKAYLAGFVFSSLLTIFFFLAFTVTIPVLKKDEVKGFHKVPTIIAAAIMCAVGLIIVAIPAGLYDSFDSIARNVSGAVSVVLAATWICLLLEAVAFLYAWYSLVLRIKSRTFFSNSLCAALIRGIERILNYFQNWKNVALRTFLPYLIFLGINGILAAITFCEEPGAIILIVIFDAAVGAFLFLESKSRQIVSDGVERIVDGDLTYQIDVDKMFDGNKKMARQVNRIGDGISQAVERSMKDERMKTELITNVSHDIKTPLTSVINYVDLLKRENLPGERAQEYLRVLDEKSQRLKVLIYDLVEASKISSGNVTLQITQLDMRELLSQCLGEFEDRFEEKNLQIVYERPEQPVMIKADSASMWRVLENLMGNVCKYAMPGSRVYIDLTENGDGTASFSMKNISENALNVSPQELTERFVRGDEARSSEGSGLGLSIARDLTSLMGGELSIDINADLFTVILKLKAALY